MAAKRRRLSRSAEFERVYRQGRSKGNRFLVLYAFPREADADAAPADGPRLGLSVSRKVGGAVEGGVGHQGERFYRRAPGPRTACSQIARDSLRRARAQAVDDLFAVRCTTGRPLSLAGP